MALDVEVERPSERFSPLGRKVVERLAARAGAAPVMLDLVEDGLCGFGAGLHLRIGAERT
jgi:hypothetical protein